jgi:Arc/MetJ-type ribon-helix-helix transcriptional regulator
MSGYRSFDDVERSARAGRFANESELRQAFVEALKEELKLECDRELAYHYLVPVLDRRVKSGVPDIMVSNLVIEVERPGTGLDMGREQLHKYFKELRERDVEIVLHGLVLDGLDAEYWRTDDPSEEPKLVRGGSMSNVVREAIRVLCSEKIPVILPEDLEEILGV